MRLRSEQRLIHRPCAYIFLQAGELAFESRVYFAKHPGLPRNVLGRQGWLRNLRLAVIDYDSLLYLSAYDS